jgi:hypothetical protein
VIDLQATLERTVLVDLFPQTWLGRLRLGEDRPAPLELNIWMDTAMSSDFARLLTILQFAKCKKYTFLNRHNIAQQRDNQGVLSLIPSN